jgi:hypothetical protein
LLQGSRSEKIIAEVRIQGRIIEGIIDNFHPNVKKIKKPGISIRAFERSQGDAPSIIANGERE